MELADMMAIPYLLLKTNNNFFFCATFQTSGTKNKSPLAPCDGIVFSPEFPAVPLTNITWTLDNVMSFKASSKGFTQWAFPLVGGGVELILHVNRSMFPYMSTVSSSM